MPKRREQLKRGMDLLGATLGLACLSPVLVVIGLAIRLTMGSPVFFRQRRPGLHGKPFEMYKFRTMLNAEDADGGFGRHFIKST